MLQSDVFQSFPRFAAIAAIFGHSLYEYQLNIYFTVDFDQNRTKK